MARNFLAGLTTNTIQVTGGTPGTNKVLTSDASGNGTWQTASSGSGDVVGPSGAVANHLAIFSGTTGKLIADPSSITYSSSAGIQVLTGSGGLTLSGSSGTTLLAGNTTNITSGTGRINIQDGNTGTVPQFNGVNAVDVSTAQTLTNKTITFPANGSPSYVAGQLVYDTTNDALTFYNSNSAIGLQIGQEQWVRVINSTGSTITNGSPVYINGASGGLPTIALAKADSASTAFPIGVATADIPNSTTGFVTNMGLVHGLNTNSYTAGQTLYLSDATAGAWVTTAPKNSSYVVPMATVVVVSATVGILYIQINTPTSRGPRVGTTVTSTAPVVNVDSTDAYTITALTTGTTVGAPTGTPVEGQEFTLRIKSAAAQTLAFNAIFRFSSDLAAPTTTIAGKTLYMRFRYNATDTKWDCMAYLNNF